jgi:hypothetical protein
MTIFEYYFRRFDGYRNKFISGYKMFRRFGHTRRNAFRATIRGMELFKKEEGRARWVYCERRNQVRAFFSAWRQAFLTLRNPPTFRPFQTPSWYMCLIVSAQLAWPMKEIPMTEKICAVDDEGPFFAL